MSDLPEFGIHTDEKLPDGLVNCIHCGKVCTYCESYRDTIRDGTLKACKVYRIGSLCDESDSWDKDDARTMGWPNMHEAVKEWNEMNTKEYQDANPFDKE